MAWVNLFNLFEKNKNFHGLLNGALDLPVNISITKFAKPLVCEDIPGLVSKLNGKLLKEIIRSPLSSPEWCLSCEGKLVNYAMFETDDGCKVENILEIDILDWLATLPNKQLKAIADCTFIGWRKNSSDGDYPTCHPKWKTDGFWKQKVRSIERQEKFFSNIWRSKNRDKVKKG